MSCEAKIIIIILVLAVLLLGFFIFKVKSASTQPLKTETVKRGTIVKTISASGRVASAEEAELKFQTSGQLAWVGVKEGDHVQAWQAIAQLDTRELQKNLEKYLRDYSGERNDFEESRRVTYGVLLPSQALTDTVKRILEKNQWDLEKAVLDVELKDIALRFATLITPIAGLVTQIDTPVAGVNITPAAAVFKITNPEKMIFKAAIDESDIGLVATGLSAKITLDVYPDKEFKGQVAKVGFASTSTSGGGTAFPVEISLPTNDNLQFKSGMNGDVEIETGKKENVLLVSNLAVINQNGKSYVFQYLNAKPVKVGISLGLQNEKDSEILKGLAEKDKVINDQTFLKEISK